MVTSAENSPRSSYTTTTNTTTPPATKPRLLLNSSNSNNTSISSDTSCSNNQSNIKQESLLNNKGFLNSTLLPSESNRSFQVISSGSCTLTDSDDQYPSNHLSSPQTITTTSITEMNLLDNVNTNQSPYQSQTLLPKTTNDSLSSFPISKPCLHFVNGAQQQHAVVFECREGWRLNDPKTKHPHSTTHNCSIKDYLVIEGNDFENCKSFLKLKDSAGGKVVTEAFFTFDPKTRKHVVEFQVVSKINNMKGNTSSRVAYIDIYDSNNKLICVSDSFWVRSRSRGQMMLDMAKRRKEPSSASKQSEIVHQSHSTTSSNDSPSDEGGEQEISTLSNVIEDEVITIPPSLKQKAIIQSPISSTNQSSSDPLSSLANVASSIVKERLPSFADLTLSSPPVPQQESATSPMKDSSLPHIDCITSDLPYRKRKISEDSRIRSLTLLIEKNSSDISKLYQLVEAQNNMISDLSQAIMQLCKKQKQQ